VPVSSAGKSEATKPSEGDATKDTKSSDDKAEKSDKPLDALGKPTSGVGNLKAPSTFRTIN
jgi:hypothetical protein